MIYRNRLKSWILKGIIKPGEAIVWRSGLSGWRKPEDLPELMPYFKQREEEQLKTKRGHAKQHLLPKKQIKNILVIDDEGDLCWLLSNALQKKGYKISIANTLSDGMACLSDKPDLLLLDLKLPDGDGMDLFPKIREITPQTPVVIISAYGSEEKRMEARDEGVYGFLDKPFTEEKIWGIMAQFQDIESSGQ
jgi:CheY-like chemotaxis protein